MDDVVDNGGRRVRRVVTRVGCGAAGALEQGHISTSSIERPHLAHVQILTHRPDYAHIADGPAGSLPRRRVVRGGRPATRQECDDSFCGGHPLRKDRRAIGEEKAHGSLSRHKSRAAVGAGLIGAACIAAVHKKDA